MEEIHTFGGMLAPFDQWQRVEHWTCSHRPFGWSVSTFPCWMRGHTIVFPACILGDNGDAPSYCEHFGNPCLLDDSYIHWGWA